MTLESEYYEAKGFASRDAEVKAKDAELASKNAAIEYFRWEIPKREDMWNQLALRDRDLMKQMAYKIDKMDAEVKAKDEEIAERKRDMANGQIILNSYRETIKKKDEEISELLAVVGELVETGKELRKDAKELADDTRTPFDSEMLSILMFDRALTRAQSLLTSHKPDLSKGESK